MSTKGSCMCGKVKFEYTGNPFGLSFCHCKMCQQSHGGPFGSYVSIKKTQFKFTKGQEFEKIYTSSQWAKRSFCSECGSRLRYILNETPEDIIMSAGAFTGDLGIKPQRHIFVKDKCNWYNINDDLPQIEKF